MNFATRVSVRPVKTSNTPQSIPRTRGTPLESAKSGLARDHAPRQRARNTQQTNGGGEVGARVFAVSQAGQWRRQTASTMTNVARRRADHRAVQQCRRMQEATSRHPARQPMHGASARLQWRCQLPVLIATAAPNTQNLPPALCSLKATAGAELAMCFAVLRRLW